MSHPYTANRIIGILPPPPGQTANFVNPPNHDAKIIALHATCLVLTTLFVGMRVCLRAFVLRQFGWDDAFCLAGWMLSVAYSAIALIGLTHGAGRHLWDIPATQAIEYGKWLFIAEVETTPVWLMIKLAFFWSYKRIFQPITAIRWLCYGGASICTAFYVAEIFHVIFVCIPVQKVYNPRLPGHCLPSGVGGSLTAVFNVITDLFIFVMPLPLAWSLHMKMGPKLRLMVLFGLGAFVNAASITRLAMTYQIVPDKDVSWKLYKLSLWVTLELNLGLICVCALVFPSFWSRVVVSSWSRLSSTASADPGFRKMSAKTTDPERDLELVHVQGQHSLATSELTVPEST